MANSCGIGLTRRAQLPGKRYHPDLHCRSAATMPVAVAAGGSFRHLRAAKAGAAIDRCYFMIYSYTNGSGLALRKVSGCPWLFFAARRKVLELSVPAPIRFKIGRASCRERV